MIDPARNFQHYEVLRRADGSPWELGRGAMGITYKAFDVNLCCEVALKVVNRALLDHPDARDRFVREARAAAALRHRNVASVYHLGNDGEHFFYAMEFIDGETLDALVRRQGPLPVGATLQVILQVAKALAAAERQHLVHRDIKPTNLMVVHEDVDDELTVKVIDFGLARPAAGAEGASALTVGGFVGTPQYASPEQLEERPLDARSDVYSLGITAWFLLTGRPPFSGSLASICQQHLSKAPPWDLLPAGVPESVRGLLAHTLEKEPENRPQNARALRAEIEACLQDVPGREIPTTWYRPSTGGTALANTPRTATTTSSTNHEELGTLGAGRYRLTRLLEEEPGTRTYQAVDLRESGNLVTVRTLPTSLTDSEPEQAALRDEVRLIQAAAHPHLVQIKNLEEAGGEPGCLVEESLAGFNLGELLAAKGGTLPLPDALAVLEQAADAADHAARCRLEHVDLALRHVHVHFPFAGTRPGEDDSLRALLSLPLERWPAWNVKIHPLTLNADQTELHTWAGDMTLMPGQIGDASPKALFSVQSRYLQSLAVLIFELLGGMPDVIAPLKKGAGRSLSLPSLSETGNALLLKGIIHPGDFADCGEFQRRLATALSERPSPRASAVSTPPRPASRQPTARGITLEKAPSTIDLPSLLPASGSTATRNAGYKTEASRVETKESTSVAELFETGKTFAEDTAVGAGSAWDRLATNGGEPARPGRWFAGLLVVGLVFVGAFAAALTLLLHGGFGGREKTPGNERTNVSSPPAPKPRFAPAAPPARVATTVPTPFTVLKAVSASPAPSLPVASPMEAPLTVRAVTPAPVPVQTPDPTPAPRLVTVHLDSLPHGAEIRLRGESLGITPTDAHLPPGDYQFIARYADWPETRQSFHVQEDQEQASTEIRLMPPGLLPPNMVPPDGPRGTRQPRRPETNPRRNPAGGETRVRPAIPVGQPPSRDTTVQRPLPLEPFVNTPAGNRGGQPFRPAPSPDEDAD